MNYPVDYTRILKHVTPMGFIFLIVIIFYKQVVPTGLK